MSDIRAIHSETSRGWDVVGSAKYRKGFQKRLASLKANDVESMWDDDELVTLRHFLREGGRAIHLQCSAGLETLLLLRLGASEVVGVDISQEMIDQAIEVSDALGDPAHWHCTDVLQAPADLNNTADLVYTGGGALPWIMDIEAWAKVVFRLLRPGGTLYLAEGHPLDFMWETEEAAFELAPGPSYCDGGVVANRGYPSGTVADNTEPHDRPVMRERIWPLGSVINSLLQAGLSLKYFNEKNDPGWPLFANMSDEVLHRLPHRYILHAEKPTAA